LSTLYVRGRALHIDPQDLATALPVADGAGSPIEFLTAALGDRVLTILATNPDTEEIADYAALLYSDATGEPFPDALDAIDVDLEIDADADYDADPDDDTADVIDLADYGISISA
jgi:hypothetical protein